MRSPNGPSRNEGGSGAMANCQELYLYRNQIGDEGMEAFSPALASGALPALKNLYLSGNPASGASQQAAKDVINNRK